MLGHVVDYITGCTKRLLLNSDCINQYKKISTQKAKANKHCRGNTRNLEDSEENIFLETMTEIQECEYSQGSSTNDTERIMWLNTFARINCKMSHLNMPWAILMLVLLTLPPVPFQSSAIKLKLICYINITYEQPLHIYIYVW